MERATLLAVLLLACAAAPCAANQPPVLTRDMDGLVVSEGVPLGEEVYQLQGSDPEGSSLRYGLSGTDRLAVNPITGSVRVAMPLDREVNDTLKLFVTLEDEVEDGNNNIVTVPVTIIIVDENDNPPVFKGEPYEVVVPEDTPVGNTVFSGIQVEDPDVIGEVLEVTCHNLPQFPDSCAKFRVLPLNASERSFSGAIILQQALDYSEQQIYQILLVAKDGHFKSSTGMELRVGDVQNTPPVFLGSLTGVVKEDAPIGTLVMTVQARDGDRGQPRKVVYELVTNPLNYFLLDPETGELRTAKPLDKEALEDSTGVLTLTVKAREVVKDISENDPLTVTTAKVTVTIKDVNDEAPRFNSREYSITIPENVPEGTPLPHLDMNVEDPDVGNNSVFSLRLEDVSGAFDVEPKSATGSTPVSIRVSNGSLDYENPNQRKFILLVIAEEQLTNPRLSSTATVTVTITDANDNDPTFDRESYTASVSETSSPGTVVTTITAKDRDSGQFGENGIIYQLDGTGADKFMVNNRTGVITVADCATPGKDPCLDYESRHEYLLTYKATDDNGEGHTTAVPVRILLIDSNDNAPQFTNNNYLVAIDEGASNFEPPLQVQARDTDVTSEITYSIVEGNVKNLFEINPHTGEITVRAASGLDMTNVTSDVITLAVQASDGVFANTATVRITVRDVNNNSPVFERESYVASIQEDSPIGTSIETTHASDADSGVNAQIKYRVQKGAFDDFEIEEDSGLVKVTKKLDYDRRSLYNIEIIAIDGGTPALTGTTTLTISIINSNDRDPFFEPSTQRAEISEDAVPGTIFYTLQARDPDVNSSDALNFEIAEPITAVDWNGKQVEQNNAFKSFFAVDRETGEVSVAKALMRDIASVVRLTVVVTDVTAPSLQQGKGILVITIIDVNDYPPTFAKPWTVQDPHYTADILEEQPPGTIIDTYTATDVDSKIAAYAIEPENEYFTIDNTTGTVRTKKRIDYEKVKQLNFTVVAYDSGIPQMSSTADVVVNVINVNDMDPVFSKTSYEAEVLENSPTGTHVITVTAKDGDEGVFGRVTYSLAGEHSADFKVGQETGEITVANPQLLDRETLPRVTVQVIASDSAPPDQRRTVAVPVYIKLLDENDNPPVFSQRNYPALIVDNLPLQPPPPIVKCHAEDPDEGVNGAVRYKIISGNEGDVFHLDPVSGILYATTSLVGKPRKFHIVVEARDGDGLGKHADNATVEIKILSVNQNKPEFIMPALANATVEVPENAGIANYLVMTVKAVDKDSGENGRISYHLRVGNNITQETNEFSINADTGELRTKIILDREVQAKYELVLVAKDHGSPVPYETMHFLTVLLVDTDDNKPEFPLDETVNPYKFRVVENTPAPQLIGRVEAIDRDEGQHARIYYYIISGNEEGGFYIDKTDGSLYANKSFDREKEELYILHIKATNDPDYYTTQEEKAKLAFERDTSIAQIQITVLDVNDNAPHFLHSDYYAGINAMANVNEFVSKLSATDPDLGDNGTVLYYIAASNLYKYGANKSSGSIIPSPFNISEEGKLVTANYMAEYNQDRFVLNIVAREKAPPEREATAKVHIWIFEPDQLIRVILSRPPEAVNEDRDEIVAELSNITKSLVVVDDIRYHVDSNGHIHHDWCDMYMHVVDESTQTIAPIAEVLKVIDAKYDYLKSYYAGISIQNVVPAFVGVQEEAFDPALAALIALIIVLFVGSITFVVVCCCLRHWVITVPTDLKKKEALIKKEILDELNTTENPLWIEQKLKLYEEQELTMQVFSEPDMMASQQPGGDGGNTGQFTQADNTYATIRQPARQGSPNASQPLPSHQASTGELADYATLSGGGIEAARGGNSAHGSLRGMPQQMFEASLGFQGSTFQVPEQHQNSNSNSDGFRSRTALTINKDGQPEFVAELI
ncbi:cadherin-87A [Schistocerca piceifrons]|uniref:cadherin-87A n=1 Tax=Schistocerca piceifrons TaxID=274613 RepID=UPI001F5E39B4|nr:cadherin-87A [Schistocerca piceifrons]XP_047099104.1 cadherin-87A [Schistocerca piceifrons]